MKILFIIFIHFSLFATTNTFYENSKEGWFYYKEEKINKKKSKKSTKKKTPPPLKKEEKQEVKEIDIPFETETQRESRIKKEDEYIKNIKWSDLDNLSVDEYKRLLNVTRNIAIGRPNKKNVKTYMALQKFWVDKSELYARVWQVSVLENPEELNYSDWDTSVKGVRQKHSKLEKEKDLFLQKVSNRFWFILIVKDINDKETVQYLKNIYNTIKRDTKVDYKILDFYEANFLVKKMKLQEKYLPAHLFLYKGNNNRPIYKKFFHGLGSVSKIKYNAKFIFDNAIEEENKNKLDRLKD